MKVYWLTNKNWEACGLQWGPGAEHILSDPAARESIFVDPLVPALLLWLGVIKIGNSVLWECEGDNDRLITLWQIKLPRLTRKHYARFAVLCAMEVYREQYFLKWALRWLSGKDRSIAPIKVVLDWTEEDEGSPKGMETADGKRSLQPGWREAWLAAHAAILAALTSTSWRWRLARESPDTLAREAATNAEDAAKLRGQHLNLVDIVRKLVQT